MKEPTPKRGNRAPVNPVLLIIFIITLAGSGIYYARLFLLQSVKTVPKLSILQTPVPNISTPVNQDRDTLSHKNPGDSTDEQLQTTLQRISEMSDSIQRDPFEPSQFFLQSTVVKNTSQMPGERPTLTLASPKPEAIWEGIMATNDNDQIVMIRYMGRSYSLRLGDPLPGTNYNLTEINPDSITLRNPNANLKLYRKKNNVNTLDSGGRGSKSEN